MINVSNIAKGFLNVESFTDGFEGSSMSVGREFQKMGPRMKKWPFVTNPDLVIVNSTLSDNFSGQEGTNQVNTPEMYFGARPSTALKALKMSYVISESSLVSIVTKLFSPVPSPSVVLISQLQHGGTYQLCLTEE